MTSRRQPFAKYFGKDYVAFGSNLVLDPDKAWPLVSRRARRSIEKAQQLPLEITQAKGTKEDINLFRTIWYNPNDPELMPELAPNQHMWLCRLEGELVAGIIVTEVESHLFLHFNGASEKGKELQIPSLMIWKMTEFFKGSRFTHLDIGCSYRPTLQEYFKNWATSEYPIIFAPPAIVPKIDLTPFGGESWARPSGDPKEALRLLTERFGERPYTLAPRGVYALHMALKHLGLQGEDEVWITSTTESPYVSSCVTSTIEANCCWSREKTAKTKAVLMIHEFGKLHPKRQELKESSRREGMPLIEDCAYAWTGGDAGTYGDFVVYSFPKFFPVQFGGLLVGAKFEDHEVWNKFQCLDVGKRNLVLGDIGQDLSCVTDIADKRRQNHAYFTRLAEQEGMEAYFKFAEDEVPGTFLLKVADPEKISGWLERFGVECGVYHGHPAVFLPVHQNLEKRHIDYIFGAIKALFREGDGLLDYAGHQHRTFTADKLKNSTL